MTSGERIRILRILHGYTQQTLADTVDVSRASIMLWEQGKSPNRRTAEELASLLEVSCEYLLEGTNLPTYACWEPIRPGHPTHLKSLATDIAHGISLLFKELRINFAVQGKYHAKPFWLCGSAPDSPDRKLNFLLTCNKSLETLLSQAIRSSVLTATNIGEVHSNEPWWGAFITSVAEELKEIFGHYPDCTRLYDRLGGMESEGEDDFTLEGLLSSFGKVIVLQGMMSDDIEIVASYLAKEVSKHSGFSNIKCSATKLLNSAIKHAKSTWSLPDPDLMLVLDESSEVPREVPQKRKRG